MTPQSPINLVAPHAAISPPSPSPESPLPGSPKAPQTDGVEVRVENRLSTPRMHPLTAALSEPVREKLKRINGFGFGTDWRMQVLDLWRDAWPDIAAPDALEELPGAAYHFPQDGHTGLMYAVAYESSTDLDEPAKDPEAYRGGDSNTGSPTAADVADIALSPEAPAALSGLMRDMGFMSLLGGSADCIPIPSYCDEFAEEGSKFLHYRMGPPSFGLLMEKTGAKLISPLDAKWVTHPDAHAPMAALDALPEGRSILVDKDTLDCSKSFFALPDDEYMVSFDASLILLSPCGEGYERTWIGYMGPLNADDDDSAPEIKGFEARSIYAGSSAMHLLQRKGRKSLLAVSHMGMFQTSPRVPELAIYQAAD